MTNKTNLTDQKPTLRKAKNLRDQNILQNQEPFLSIDKNMLRLRKKRERLHVNQCLFFTKKVQEIFEEEFSFEMALVILEKTWPTASKSQKEEWRRCVPSFRASFTPPYEQKPHAH